MRPKTLKGPGLYLRELDQLGTPARLVAWLKASPFRWAAFHANAERQSKTLVWAAAVRAAEFGLALYTTPGGLTPENYRAQVRELVKLATKAGARMVILDMEAPWRNATPDAMLDCCRQAASGGHEVQVTTVPGHPAVKALGRLLVAGIAVQVYDRRNTFSEARIRSICAATRRLCKDADFDLPAWNKTPARLERHLRNVPRCVRTCYWMADNPGQDDLPPAELLGVIAQMDPSLGRPAT